MHIEFLLEEESSAEALNILVPKLGVVGEITFTMHPFQGKTDLIKQLPYRMKGYSQWIPDDWRIVVLLDRDNDDCVALKAELEGIALIARLSTRSSPGIGGKVTVVNRIAIEELEAWFFGDVAAICAAYPGVPLTLAAKAPFRHSDAIAGGTWERLEQVLQAAGHYAAGMPKIEVARRVAAQMQPSRNRSPSFKKFHSAISDLISV